MQGQAPGFDFGNIIGDPFALATISIAILAWLIGFIAQVLASLDDKLATVFPKFSWWTISYEALVILGVAIIIVMGRVPKYQVAMVGFVAAGTVFTCSAANTFVYSETPTMEAAGAGHILLSIVQIIWIFYFGTTPDHLAPSAAYMDSYNMHKDSKHMHSTPYGLDRPHTSTSSHQAPQMYTSAQLNGFETASPISNQHATDYRNSRLTTGLGGAGQGLAPESEVSVPTDYPYQAKAIYSYDANPEDANEISFVKHEILEVSDVSGRWWQARKKNGDTGIAPSNYLILL